MLRDTSRIESACKFDSAFRSVNALSARYKDCSIGMEDSAEMLRSVLLFRFKSVSAYADSRPLIVVRPQFDNVNCVNCGSDPITFTSSEETEVFVMFRLVK